MGLKEYHKKRHLNSTSEPAGGKPDPQESVLHFVVQKHAASHLHYDFRLEVGGVLKSWAIPKGPSMNPSDTRLAIQVEDHPFDYRRFEGVIPKGNYGAGTVMVWDEGTYFVATAYKRDESEALMAKGLEEGKLHFILEGHKLKGEFSLIRLKDKDNKQWIFKKKRDQFATLEDIREHDVSVISHRSMEEIGGK